MVSVQVDENDEMSGISAFGVGEGALDLLPQGGDSFAIPQRWGKTQYTAIRGFFAVASRSPESRCICFRGPRAEHPLRHMDGF